MLPVILLPVLLMHPADEDWMPGQTLEERWEWPTA
jgi:hypothetical protein